MTAKKISKNTSYKTDTLKLERYGVALDPDGRYKVCLVKEENFSDAKAYFFDETFKKRRIATSTFIRWIQEGKAVEVD